MVRRGLLVAGLVVLFANTIILGLAAYNRSGEPDATVILTERELRLVNFDTDSTALDLQFAFAPSHDPYEGRAGMPGWFDQAALESIGFDCRVPAGHRSASRHYGAMMARRAYAVLEVEGDSWQARLGGIRQAPARPRPQQGVQIDSSGAGIARQERGATRLTVIDAGKDPAALRQRHPDRRRSIIVPALVRAIVIEPDGDNPARLAGRVVALLPPTVHVPNAFRSVLARLVKGPARTDSVFNALPAEPRYAVTLKFGRRHEPWVVDVQLLPATITP